MLVYPVGFNKKASSSGGGGVDPFASDVLFYVNYEHGKDDTASGIIGNILGSGSLAATPYTEYSQAHSTNGTRDDRIEYTGFTPIAVDPVDWTWETLSYWTATPTAVESTGSFASNITASSWGIANFASNIYFVRTGSARLNLNLLSTSIPANQLIHFAVVCDNNVLTAYYNGVASGANPTHLDSTMSTLTAFYSGYHNGYGTTACPQYNQIMRFTNSVRYSANFDPVNDTIFPLNYS